MTQDKKNRVLARWLGWQHIICLTEDGEQCCGLDGSRHWHKPFIDDGCPCGGEHGNSTDLPDFYHDEAASALLLEKMRSHAIWIEGYETGWIVHVNPHDPFRFEASDRDRKTAIAEAALKLIEQERRKL